mmetsp:Transcript_2181/g.3213  ORF Transcript_2181/g.3213 Transcript_2181/m.3213 type:complete len:174 (-) Transcript_2181:124-645(-)
MAYMQGGRGEQTSYSKLERGQSEQSIGKQWNVKRIMKAVVVLSLAASLFMVIVGVNPIHKKTTSFVEMKQNSRLSREIHEPLESPSDCQVFFDGCNTCHRANSQSVGACTMMACEKYGEPKCKKWFVPDSFTKCQFLFDGCNRCRRVAVGAPLLCTKMFCREYGKPKCNRWFD